MTRFNFGEKITINRDSIASQKNAGALLFAVLLIICSVATGCSSEKPQPAAVNPQPVNQSPAPVAMSALSTPVPEAAKPAAKKVVHKRPPTMTYADKTYGVSFDYPRKYAIETGDAAQELVSTSPLPMNFVQPGGTALAAVELPETSFPSTDFSSAFFDVSVNKGLTAELCEQFSVPAPKAAETSTSGPQLSKLMVGDMELYGTETVTGDGPRQSDAKYFHIFQNGSCYEFALNVTTNASELEAGMKHVDRDKVFDRLAKILATVKISEAAAPEVTASVGTTASVPVTSDKPTTAAAGSDSGTAEGAKASDVSKTSGTPSATPTATQTNPPVQAAPAPTEASPQ
jgi:hypothetical protein